MSKQLRILLVEDSVDDALLLQRAISKGGYELACHRVESEEGMRQALTDGEWDLVISDYDLPGFSALKALDLLRQSGIDLPFIIVSGKIGENLAVEAVKAGAHDYVMKGNLARLVPVLERELREATDRRRQQRAEAAIRQGKLELEAVLDTVTDLFILTDLAGRIVRCNRKVIEYFATTYMETIGREIGELFFGAQQTDENLFRCDQQCLPGHEEEMTFPRLKGWFTVTCYPLHSVEKHAVGRVFIVKDITRRKEMEEEKRKSDRELLALYAIAFRLNSQQGSKKVIGDLLFQIHNMLQIDFSCIHLMEKRRLILNNSLGLSRAFVEAIRHLPLDTPWISEVLAGKPVKSRIHAREMPAELVQAAQEMGIHAWCAVPLKIGTEVVGVLTVAHQAERSFSDREVFLLTSIASQLAVLIENHSLYGRMKEKAEELQRSRKALKENLEQVKLANIELGRLNTAKNTFIGMASHELKTPITSILGGIQFLYQYSGLQMSPEQREIFASVHEGVQQLKTLVDDLLSISRIEANGFSVHKRPLPLLTVCREVYEGFSLPLSQRQIVVEVSGDDPQVPADESFTRLVVRNLLENAIKFTPDGGSIRICGQVTDRPALLSEQQTLQAFYADFPGNLPATDRYFRLDVSDTGIGIPDGERVRIFEKFYALGDISYHSSGKTDFLSKGSGLGLSIVKGIMDAHGGMAWVSPGAEGTGSVFSLLFPME